VQKGSALALACRPLVFSGVWRSRPPGGGSLWGPGLGPLYALDKLVRACASSPKISWGGHQILPTKRAENKAQGGKKDHRPRRGANVVKGAERGTRVRKRRT
jgi:hypothetical protein